jgi:hypothetical protein
MKKNRKLSLPILLFIGVLVLSIGALAISSAVQNRQVSDPSIGTQDDVPRISAEEAYEAVMAGEAVLVDTRSLAEFETQRAAGAISIPIGETEARLGELDPDTWVITYCT